MCGQTRFYHYASVTHKLCGPIHNTVQYVKTALKKKVESHGSGFVEPDQREKHHNQPFKYQEVMRNLIRAHIHNFLIIDSHYVRATTSKQFLPEELNVSMMSRMLMTEVRRAGIENVEISRHLYDHILRHGGLSRPCHRRSMNAWALTGPYAKNTKKRKGKQHRVEKKNK
uniref:Uncharacterized protein n=1 Tax=Trichogramma kaykai TaxID=54128 RepID=A0ABD2WZ52_9HYME